MRTGVMVARLAPMHIGHANTIGRMTQVCENVVVLLGQPREERSHSEPWLLSERKQQIINVFGNRIIIGEITDLDGASPHAWGQYVLEQAASAMVDAGFAVSPATDYFCGSYGDGGWLSQTFFSEFYHSSPGPDHRLPIGWADTRINDVFRRLHVVDRFNDRISATEIKLLMRFSNKHWKDFVPEVNHVLIEDGYQAYLKQSIDSLTEAS